MPELGLIQKTINDISCTGKIRKIQQLLLLSKTYT